MADMTPHETVAHEALSLPVMVPGKLFGRDVTLGRIYAQLKQNKPVLLHGAAGIGKTALAASLAGIVTAQPGGVLWLSVDNSPLPDLVARAARAYQLTEITSKDNPASMVNSLSVMLANQHPLIVLDGRIAGDVAAAFIRQCAINVPVLLVNEEEISGEWMSLRLGKLEPEPASALLRAYAGLPDALDADAARLISGIAQALDYHPLALTLSGAAMKADKLTPKAFVAQLTATPNASSLTPPLLVLSTLFRTLDSRLKGLLFVLGSMFKGQASAELIGMVGNAPEDVIHSAMGLLLARNLVERFYRYDIPYYRLHPTVLTFVQASLRSENKLDGLQAHISESLVAYARKYATDDAAAHDKLSIEIDNVMAAARWSASRGDREVAEQFSTLLARAGGFVQTRGYVYEVVTLQQIGASSVSAFPAHERSQERTAPMPAPLAPAIDDDDEDELDFEDTGSVVAMDDEDASIGLSERDAPPVIDFDNRDMSVYEDEEDEVEEGEFVEEDDLELVDDLDLDDDDEEDEDEAADDEEDEAIRIETPDVPEEVVRLRTALLTARQNNDIRQQAALLASIGLTQMQFNHDSEAIASYSEALTLYENLNDSFGMLSTLEALTTLTARTESLQAVVMYATRGITLAKNLGREEAQARLLTALGDARQQLGDSDQAARVYGQALDLRRAAGDEEEEAVVLFKLGFAQLDSGDPEEAIATWEDALTLFREQGRRDYEARTLGGIGTANGELEHWTEAINMHSSALHIAREVGDKEEEALQLSNLGYAAVQSNDLKQAVLRYRQALHLAYAANDRQNIVSNSVDLARLLVESPRHIEIAALLVEEALKADPNDRDLRKLMERIEDEREALGDVERAPINGTAQDYAANAYRLLE
jgi:tetratricopeptide (TPR) repeat protein